MRPSRGWFYRRLGLFAVAMLVVVGTALVTWLRRSLPDGDRVVHHVDRELLDVTAKSGDKSDSDCLAASSTNCRDCQWCSLRSMSQHLYICQRKIRGAAVGLLALLRNEGGSVGTSVAQITQERREQFHTLRLNENLDKLNQPVNNLLAQESNVLPAAYRRFSACRIGMAVGVLDQSVSTTGLVASLL